MDIIRLGAVVVFAAGALGSDPPSSNNADATKPVRTDVILRGETDLCAQRDDSPICRLLNKRIDHVHWQETPFNSVIDWLRALTTDSERVNIIVRWRYVFEIGVTPDSPITLDVANATVAEILNQVLDQLGGEGSLGYVGINRRLRISTRLQLERKCYTRIYDATKLLAHIDRFFDLSRVDVPTRQEPADHTPFLCGLGLAMKEDNQSEAPHLPKDHPRRAQAVLMAIKSTVEPDSWAESGGHGTAAVFGNMLTIRNTLSVQGKLTALFELTPTNPLERETHP